MTPTVRLLSTALTCLSVVACRPVIVVPAPIPDAVSRAASTNGMRGDAAASSSAAPSSSAADSTTVRSVVPLVTTDDDLARTVVAVFGDSVALHPDSGLTTEDAPLWDLDVESYETHDRVAHYVQLFSTTGRDRFAARLSRGTRFEPMIRQKLRASGMPEDLTYLALIESGYDPHAYSRAAAVGMWQFMSGTARGVGMRVDWWVDDRRDPTRATEGAIRFLGDLQKQFGSLYLAAAAYNGGPGRVARGLTRFAEEMEGAEGEDRFFALAEQNYLRSETKNYVPQLIAAALVAKSPERYGLVVDTVAPYGYDSVRVGPGTSLAVIASASNASAAEIKDLNPAILRGISPPDDSMWIHVPVASGPQVAAYLDSVPSEAVRGYRTLKVSGSVTPTTLAKREGVSVTILRRYNPTMRTARSGRLVEGQTLRIPASAVYAFSLDVPDPSIERYGGSSVTLARSGLHVVKRGETLGGIAKRYRMTVARVQSLNGLRGTGIRAGQTLRVASTAAPAGKASTAKSKARTGATKSTPKSASAKKAVAKKSVAKKPVTKKPATKSATKPTARKGVAKGS